MDGRCRGSSDGAGAGGRICDRPRSDLLRWAAPRTGHRRADGPRGRSPSETAHPGKARRTAPSARHGRGRRGAAGRRLLADLRSVRAGAAGPAQEGGRARMSAAGCRAAFALAASLATGCGERTAMSSDDGGGATVVGQVDIAIDAAQDRAPISPYVYGSNQDYAGNAWTVRRFGGN